jgi:hypothetical protein
VIADYAMEIDIISYEKTYSEVLKVAEWLSSQGFEHWKTRIGFYERTIKELLKTYRSGSREKLIDEFPKYGNAIYEIFDLITIYRGLSKMKDPALSPLLEKYLGGPVTYPDEDAATSSNVGRNTAFHLVVASKLSNSELEPRLEAPSDIAFQFEEYCVFIECKRPQTAKKLEASIKDGRGQPIRRISSRTSPLYCGMIALDFTKTLNPNFLLLVKQTPGELKAKLEDITNSFLSANVDLWQKPQKSRIFGVLSHFSVMAIVEDRDLLTHCRQFSLNPMEACGSRLKSMAWRLANQLGSTTREILTT